MTDKACAKCEYWRREGVDGICFGATPTPKVAEQGKEYILVWPRTQADEYCPLCTNTEDTN